jgi:hypothetical protein
MLMASISIIPLAKVGLAVSDSESLTSGSFWASQRKKLHSGSVLLWAGLCVCLVPIHVPFTRKQINATLGNAVELIGRSPVLPSLPASPACQSLFWPWSSASLSSSSLRYWARCSATCCSSSAAACETLQARTGSRLMPS